MSRQRYEERGRPDKGSCMVMGMTFGFPVPDNFNLRTRRDDKKLRNETMDEEHILVREPGPLFQKTHGTDWQITVMTTCIYIRYSPIGFDDFFQKSAWLVDYGFKSSFLSLTIIDLIVYVNRMALFFIVTHSLGH